MGEMINLIKSAIQKGCISWLGSLNCNCNPTATSATGTMVFAKAVNTLEITSGKGVLTKNSAMSKKMNGGKVNAFIAMSRKLISL